MSSPVILFFKSHVAGYTRRDGTYVKPYSNKRTAHAEAMPGQMALFMDQPKDAPAQNPFKGKDPVASTPDIFGDKPAAPVAPAVPTEDSYHPIAHMAVRLSGGKQALGDLVAGLRQVISADWRHEQERSKPAFAHAYRSYFTDAGLLTLKLDDLAKKHPKLKIMQKIAGPEAMYLISQYAEHRYYEPDEHTLRGMIEESAQHLSAKRKR